GTHPENVGGGGDFKKNCRRGVGNRKKRMYVCQAKYSIWAFYRMPSYSLQFLFIFHLTFIKICHLLLNTSLGNGSWGGALAGRARPVDPAMPMLYIYLKKLKA